MFITLHQLEAPDRYSDILTFTETILVNKTQICYFKKHIIDISESVKEKIIKESSNLKIENLEATMIYFTNGYKIIVAESKEYISSKI